ncbi:hypothetical protein SCUCBS95973_004020 [Sporothrix curviconia]|uniref:Uncharacterized protein n=1 Tax=Sporothrix curviconia TaxID=1260050 RepID=A0ABP0BLE2_9PEZI
MGFFSFLHRLVCKKCKATSGSSQDHREHRHKERRRHRVLKKRQISPPLPSSSRSAAHRIPAETDLRLQTDKCSSVSSMPPQLTLPWESRPRPPPITELPVVIPVYVQPLAVQPQTRRDYLLLPDSPTVASREPLISSSPSAPSPASLSTRPPITPSARIPLGYLSDGPPLVSFRNRMAARQTLLENSSSNGSSHGNPGHRPHHSDSSIDSATTTCGPRYIPSSKSLPRPRSVAVPPSTQQTLPFLRTCKPFDEIPMAPSQKPCPFESPSTLPPRAPTFSFHPPPPPPPLSLQLSHSFANRPARCHQPSPAPARILSNNYTPFRKPPFPSGAGFRLLIPYDSERGRSMLKALRRLLVIPAEWSAAQTLLFVLKHPRLRCLNLPSGQPSSSLSPSAFRDLLNVLRCNCIDWKGVLQSIDVPTQYRLMQPVSAATSLSSHPFSVVSVVSAAPASPSSSLSPSSPLATFTHFSASDSVLVSNWLEKGKPLFTRQTSLKSLLLRRVGAGRPVQGRQDDRLTTAGLYDIALNRRCRYHQLWSGAGASPLSSNTALDDVECVISNCQ